MGSGILQSGGQHRWEPVALIAGLLCILVSVAFFLQRFEMISLAVNFTDAGLLMFFAGATFLAGVIMLLSTVGMFGTD